MKKTLLIALFLSINLLAFGQNYQGYVPFPTSGTYWVETHETTTWQQSSKCISRQYEFVKDTVINGLQYHKMQVTVADRSRSSGCGPFWAAQITTHSFGYIRNDSLNKKVWLRLSGSNVDSLFYDFDLKLGDTISPDPILVMVVDSIDTVFINNRYRKKFYLRTSGIIIEYLIEGIGSSSGFGQRFCNIPLAGSFCTLDCFGDSSIFSNSRCQLITNIEESKVEESIFKLYPNPSDGTIMLSAGARLHSIAVYNLQGQKVQEVPPQARSWQLPGRSGLYLIRMQDVNGNFYMKKVIRN